MTIDFPGARTFPPSPNPTTPTPPPPPPPTPPPPHPNPQTIPPVPLKTQLENYIYTYIRPFQKKIFFLIHLHRPSKCDKWRYVVCVKVMFTYINYKCSLNKL